MDEQLPKIAICGPGRAGKDTAANWLAANTPLRLGRTTSQVIAPYVARRLGIPVEQAFGERHQNRQLWFDVGNELRKNDPAYLVRECLRDGEIVVGLRNHDEIATAMAENLIDTFVWVQRDVPIDSTMMFNSSLCDIVIENTGSVEQLESKLRGLAMAMRLFFGKRIETITYVLVPDFEAYRVGDDGSVWTRWIGGSKRHLSSEWRQLRPWRNGSYWQVSLFGKERKRDASVHRLILEAFIGPCPRGMVACHNNGHGTDNRLCNLRWDTPKENQLDRVKHGTHPCGEKHGCAKLTAEHVREIRRRREAGETLDALAAHFTIDRSAVWSICQRKRWKHVA